jgi:diguanylate cyclase (GGDEF)-like protein
MDDGGLVPSDTPGPSAGVTSRPTPGLARGEALADLLGEALDALDEGMAILDGQSVVVGWNAAAEAMSGYQRAEVMGRPCPEGLFTADGGTGLSDAGQNEAGLAETGWNETVSGWEAEGGAPQPTGRPAAVRLRHRLGHCLPAMLRRTQLRDALGVRSGTLLRFHPVEEIDALARGGAGVESRQSDLAERLEEAWSEWRTNLVPFGLLWMKVDQAAGLRKSHGRDACEAMLAIVERTILHGLRPTEIVGRWGRDEFLVLAHERTAEMLERHAERLVEMARTAEFHWWGDRVRLTASIGAAQAAEGVSLNGLLARAERAMWGCAEAGGNRASGDAGNEAQSMVISMPGGRGCSQL